MKAPVLLALLLVGCATSKSDDVDPGSGQPDAGKQEMPRIDGAVATPDAAPQPDAAPGTPDAAPQPDSAVVADAAVPRDAAPPRDAQPIDATLVDAAVTGGCTQLPATGSATVNGATTAASPTWPRPLANTCPASDVSAVGTAVPYQVQVFCNGGATRSFDIAMDGNDEVATLTHTDPYLVIYSGAAIPANALMCAAGNDDASTISAGSLVTGLSVPAGGQIAVVATGFENTDLGTYQLRITAR